MPKATKPRLATDVFGRLDALADPVRARLLLVLERQECTVSELCGVVQLPQSTVSRHLKELLDSGFLLTHAAGTTRRYRLPADRLDDDAKALWSVVREQTSRSPGAAHDARRLRSVMERRRTRSRRFFSTAAAEWDRLREELVGHRGDVIGLFGLIDDRWTIGDLGCGTGLITEMLAPFVERVVAVDSSSAMLAAARERLAPHRNVELREGELESLPIEAGKLDAALLVLVLAYLAEPRRAIEEAARAVRPGGRVVIVDMMPHDRADLAARMGHLWFGFPDTDVVAWLSEAGLGAPRYHPLPADPAARGPTLFAASGRVRDVSVAGLDSDAELRIRAA